MKKASSIATMIGMGLVLSPWAISQAPAEKPAAAPAQAVAAPPAIPPDQQATKEQLARLFEVMRMREQLASVTKMMPSVMQQQMGTLLKQMEKDHPEMASMSEEQQQAFGKVMGRYMERVMGLYTSDDMLSDMAGIYQKYLTRSDVDGIIAFYGSPAGQHMLDEQPMMMKDSMTLVMQRMQDRMKPVIDELTKEMENLVKPQAPVSVKPGTK